MAETDCITVLGSSRELPGSIVYQAALDLGRCAARRGLLVCNGGYGGVMEACARGAREAGGDAVGVIMGGTPNRWISRVIRLGSYRERLFRLLEASRRYVFFPGGAGTLVELSVVLEMMSKARWTDCRAVFMGEFWQPVVELACPEQELPIKVCDDANTALDWLTQAGE